MTAIDYQAVLADLREKRDALQWAIDAIEAVVELHDDGIAESDATDAPVDGSVLASDRPSGVDTSSPELHTGKMGSQSESGPSSPIKTIDHPYQCSCGRWYDEDSRSTVDIPQSWFDKPDPIREMPPEPGDWERVPAYVAGMDPASIAEDAPESPPEGQQPEEATEPTPPHQPTASEALYEAAANPIRPDPVLEPEELKPGRFWRAMDSKDRTRVCACGGQVGWDRQGGICLACKRHFHLWTLDAPVDGKVLHTCPCGETKTTDDTRYHGVEGHRTFTLKSDPLGNRK